VSISSASGGVLALDPQTGETLQTVLPTGKRSFGIGISEAVVIGGGQGDPHLSAPNGVKFDFNGEPNGDYVLFSAPQLQVNMHLAGDGPAMRFMTAIAVVFRNVTIQVSVQFMSDEYIAQINAQLAPFGAKATYIGLELRLAMCQGVEVLISQMVADNKAYPTLVHDDGSKFYYLDIQITTPHCSDAYDGALGQTYKCVYVEGRDEFKFDHASEESFRVKSLVSVNESSFNVAERCSLPPFEARRKIGGMSH
jgi:hypothetical protein